MVRLYSKDQMVMLSTRTFHCGIQSIGEVSKSSMVHGFTKTQITTQKMRQKNNEDTQNTPLCINLSERP